jgi:hypothetical protein
MAYSLECDLLQSGLRDKTPTPSPRSFAFPAISGCRKNYQSTPGSGPHSRNLLCASYCLSWYSVVPVLRSVSGDVELSLGVLSPSGMLDTGMNGGGYWHRLDEEAWLLSRASRTFFIILSIPFPPSPHLSGYTAFSCHYHHFWHTHLRFG